MPEASMSQTEHGRVPAGDGWFVLNLAAPAMRHEEFGSGMIFESGPGQFPQFGINVRWLEPGQPASVYHCESAQEAYFVLAGEATLLVDEEERPLRQWDFVHLPPHTPHVLVGAGSGPCAVLMVGSRGPEQTIAFPSSELAARHGASAPEGAGSREEAYADRAPGLEPRESFWPPSS